MGWKNSTYESWGDHRERIDAERAKAERDNLCAEIVNDWAGNDTKRKICMRKKNIEAVQQGHEVCGMHFRQIRKEEVESAQRADERRQREIEWEKRKKLDAVKDEAEIAIITRLAELGATDAEISKPWHYRTVKKGWTVTIPLSVMWKLLDELPMLDPDAAVEAFEENERLAAEATKPVDTPAPF